MIARAGVSGGWIRMRAIWWEELKDILTEGKAVARTFR
jgi:hypothetical protein